MTLKQLQAKARELQIVGRSKMNKAQLESAIDQATQKPVSQPETPNTEPSDGINNFSVEHVGNITVDGNNINGVPVSQFLNSLTGNGIVTGKGQRRRVRRTLQQNGFGSLIFQRAS